LLTGPATTDVQGSPEALHKLAKEWDQLQEDRKELREIFRRPEVKMCLPCNLKRLIWNAQKLFKADLHRPSGLNPVNVVESVEGLVSSLASDGISKHAEVSDPRRSSCM
jgi:DNA-directed RNA polymerase II subunit RPB1